MELSWSPIWGVATTGAVAASLVVLVLVTYPPRVRHLAVSSQRMLIGLRLIATMILLISLFRPGLTYATKEGDEAVIAFLYDSSRSMGVKEGGDVQTRREKIVRLRGEVSAAFDDLKKELTVQEFDFAESLNLLSDEAVSDKSEGLQTPLGRAMELLLERMTGQPLRAVFLWSDGAERSLPPHNRSPRSAALELARRGIPLYTTPIGTTSLVDHGTDLAIDELTLDPVAFEKKTIPIRAVLRVMGQISQPYKIRLLVEDRTGKRLGESGPMRHPPATRSDRTELIVPPVASGQTIPLELTYTPTQTGEIKIGVEVEAVEGEVQVTNNRRESLTSVRGGGLKVAYFDILRNEVKFIRSLNSSSNIQIDFQLVSFNKGSLVAPIDPAAIEASNYDVYLIGDVPASAFGNELLQKLASKVRQGAGLMMIGGFHNFSAGGYANTPIAEFLPVELKASAAIPSGGRPDASLQIAAEVTLRPTPLGLRHYVMLIDQPEKNEATWAALPALSGVNRLRPRNEAVEVLATTVAGDPVLLALDIGRNRSVALGTDETYYWYLSGQPQKHQRFWRQLILWLAHKEFETDQSIWVKLDHRNVAPGSELTASFGLRGADGHPVSGAAFKASLVSPDGKTSVLESQRDGDSGRAVIQNTLVPGDYWVSVEATHNGNSAGLPGTSRFIVDHRDLELDQPQADPAFLAQLSEITADLTDGHMIPPENMAAFLNDFITKKPWKTDLEAAKRIDLWQGWPILLAFVAVVSLEWITRKRMELT